MARDLTNLHPEVRAAAIQLIAQAQARGVWAEIASGYRSVAEQDALYAKGRTAPGPRVTNARGGESYHNYGLAFDLMVLRPGGLVAWDYDTDLDKDAIPDYTELGHIGEALGLEWGGRWHKPDWGHFQKTFGLTIAALQAGSKPWEPSGPSST